MTKQEMEASIDAIVAQIEIPNGHTMAEKQKIEHLKTSGTKLAKGLLGAIFDIRDALQTIATRSYD